MIDIIGTLRHMYRRVNQIFDFSTAGLQLAETGGTITTIGPGTEQDIYRVETPMGSFEPVTVILNMTNNTAAETIRVRVYYRVSATAPAGGVKQDEMIFAGVQNPALKVISLEPNRFGVRVTMELLAGAALTYLWEAHFRS